MAMADVLVTVVRTLLEEQSEEHDWHHITPRMKSTMRCLA